MCYVEELTFLIQVKDDLTELAGTIAGPPDTPYQGGKFKLEIKIPDTYPFNPPKVIIYSSLQCSGRVWEVLGSNPPKAESYQGFNNGTYCSSV